MATSYLRDHPFNRQMSIMSAVSLEQLMDAFYAFESKQGPKPPPLSVVHVSPVLFHNLCRFILPLYPGGLVFEGWPPNKIVHYGLKIHESRLLPAVFRYPACDIKTRTEISITEEIHAFLVPEVEIKLDPQNLGGWLPLSAEYFSPVSRGRSLFSEIKP